MVDDLDGSGLSITFAEDDADFDAATHAILTGNARRGPYGFTGSPTDVTTYRVHAYSTSA